MEKIPLRDIVSTFNLQTLKDIAYSLDFTIQGNKQDIIDTIIDRIGSPEEVIDILRVEELKNICLEFGLKSGNKQELINTVKELVDIELFKRNKNWAPLEQLPATYENVETKLNQLKLSRRSIDTEKDAEEKIFNYLTDYFPNVMTQYNIGGYLALKVDIDIDNGKFGVEVKLSESFFKQSSEIFRMIGQSVFYKKRRYGENYILVVAGPPNDYSNPLIKEALSFVNDTGIKTKWINIE